MNYLSQRLQEPSTWAGIAAVIASASQAAATRDPAAIGATVAGIVAMLAPEGRRPQPADVAPVQPPAPATKRKRKA